MCERWTPCPGPEPVAAFVQPSAALAPAAHAPRIPHLAADLERASIPDLAAFAQAPGPEALAAFVQAVAALAPAPIAGTIRLTWKWGSAAPGCAPRVVQPLGTG